MVTIKQETLIDRMTVLSDHFEKEYVKFEEGRVYCDLEEETFLIKDERGSLLMVDFGDNYYYFSRYVEFDRCIDITDTSIAIYLKHSLELQKTGNIV